MVRKTRKSRVVDSRVADVQAEARIGTNNLYTQHLQSCEWRQKAEEWKLGDWNGLDNFNNKGSNRNNMKCTKCEHKWNYKGTSIVYAVCPRCRYNNRLVTMKSQA